MIRTALSGPAGLSESHFGQPGAELSGASSLPARNLAEEGKKLMLTARKRGTGTPRIRPAEFGWESLTHAELKVARLVADGLTNRRVATLLCVSPHTVDSQLRRVFAKLEVSCRVELTRYVVTHDIDQAHGAA